MKKTILYITGVLLLTIMIAGSTYAYLSATISSEQNAIRTQSNELNVVYTGGSTIAGNLNLSVDKSGGLNTSVNIRLDTKSVKAKGNLYINIDEISQHLSVNGFNWEVYGVSNNELVYEDTGTFEECRATNGIKKCEQGDRLYIVNDYQLTTTNTTFTVYVWLDGNKVGNEVIGQVFRGTIVAETEKYTTDIDG